LYSNFASIKEKTQEPAGSTAGSWVIFMEKVT